MDNRFAQAVKQKSNFENAGENFFNASMELAKELCEKGVRGEKLSQKEHEFIKTQTLFMLQGLVTKAEG